jgi:hypothetical protein
MHDKPVNLRKLCHVALAATCVVFTFKLLLYHGWLICFPWPNQTREAAIMLSTDLLLKGGNPYLLSNQPIYTNLYGLLFNFCVYPAALVFGPTLMVHKAVAGGFLLCSCGLYYRVMRRAGIAPLYAWSAALILYASLLMRTTPLPGPDTMGTFLMLLTVFLPWLRNFSWSSLLASAVFGLAAFYTKPYFVVGVFCLGSFLLCFVSAKKGLVYLLASGLLFLVSFAWVSRCCETYFYEVFLMHRNSATYATHYMVRQLWAYFLFYRELLLLLFWVTGMGLLRWAITRSRFKQPARMFSAAKLAIKPILLPVYGFCFMLLLFCFKLGGYNGNWLAYPFQLVTPFLLLIVFRALRDDQRSSVISVALLAAGLFFMTRGFTVQPVHQFETHENWEKIQVLVGSHTNILSAPPVAPLLIAQGKPVYDSGHSEAFVLSASKSPPVPFLFPLLPQIKERNRQYLAQIAADIRAKRFDLLLVNESLSAWLLPPQSVLSTYYEHQDSVRIFMPHSEYSWAIDIWEPKP